MQCSGQAHRQLLRLVHVRDEGGKEPTDAQPAEVGWDWDMDHLVLGLFVTPPLAAKESGWAPSGMERTVVNWGWWAGKTSPGADTGHLPPFSGEGMQGSTGPRLQSWDINNGP